MKTRDFVIFLALMFAFLLFGMWMEKNRTYEAGYKDGYHICLDSLMNAEKYIKNNDSTLRKSVEISNFNNK